ncbi:MAG: hypothetical protein K2H16_06465 [Prevotella sp.]|nr:hypothetical protein [Prevotella sp.]
MKRVLYTVIVIAFIGCHLDASRNIHDEILPVTASLKKISYTYFEDFEFNKRNNFEEKGQMYLELTLLNPNEDTVCLPMDKVYMDSVFVDTFYKSRLFVSLRGHQLDIHKQTPHPLMLRGKGTCSIRIKLQNIPANDLYDIQKTIANLKFEYAKSNSDSIYCKKKIGDIEFTVDKNIVISKIPEIFWNNNIQHN